MSRMLSVIPNPVSITYTEGFFKCSGLPLIKGDDKEFADEIKLFSDQFADNEERKAIVYCRKNAGISHNEGYNMVISKEAVHIDASSSAGIYHGLQTLRQLIISEFKNGELVLPCAEITDYPRFSWRGFMLDSSRYFYSIPFIKKMIDLISMHHMNRFHWHLTDDQGWRLPVDGYPLLTEIGACRKDRRFTWKTFKSEFYTEEEIREVVKYASVRHVEVVPEVDFPGHASAILASYPGLGCTGGPYRVEDRFGIFEDVLCAGNDQLFNLAAASFDSLFKLFPSKWVHIGGDEVKFNRWEECPKCQKRLEELELEKPQELQSWITQKLVQMLAERGKTAIGWDEVLDDSENFKLPKETVIMSWRGSEGGIRASGLGHSVIMSPNTEGCYLDYKHFNTHEEPGQLFEGSASVYKSYSMEPVPPAIKNEDSSLILGAQGNLWSELIYAGKIAEYMIFPRLCAISESVWTSKENRDFDDFSKRLEVHKERLDLLGVNQYRGALK